jgi:hypothetical protein
MYPLHKHFASSLKINATNFIFKLVHIPNLPTLVVLIPLCSPCTPSTNYAHLFVDYTNFYVDCANKSNDCANTLDDWANTSVDSNDTFDRSSLDVYIPNSSLLQLLPVDLLVIYSSKINIVLTVGSFIYCSSSLLCIHGFCISRSSFSSSISKFSA